MLLKKYEHSGKLGISVPLIILAGISGAAVLAAIYSASVVYIPIGGSINFVFTFLFALGLGYMNSWLGYLGKCRNPFILSIMGLGTGLIGLYWSWCFFIVFLFEKNAIPGVTATAIATSPSMLFDIIRNINATGWFSIKGATPSGVLLWVLWLIEALVVLFFAFDASSKKIVDRVFCENCNEWAHEAKGIDLDLPENNEEFQALLNGDVEVIKKSNQVEGDFFPRMQLLPISCNSCSNTQGVRMMLASLEQNEEGKFTEKVSNLTGPFLADKDCFQELLDMDKAPFREIEEETEQTGEE